MQNLAHADIFFLVTTISVGVLTIGLIVVIVWLLRLLQSLREMVAETRAELSTVSNYLDTQMKTSQSRLSAFALVAEGLMRLYGSFASPKNSKKKNISSKKK